MDILCRVGCSISYYRYMHRYEGDSWLWNISVRYMYSTRLSTRYPYNTCYLHMNTGTSYSTRVNVPGYQVPVLRGGYDVQNLVWQRTAASHGGCRLFPKLPVLYYTSVYKLFPCIIEYWYLVPGCGTLVFQSSTFMCLRLLNNSTSSHRRLVL